MNVYQFVRAALVKEKKGRVSLINVRMLITKIDAISSMLKY